MSKEKAILGQVHSKNIAQPTSKDFQISSSLEKLIQNLDTGVAFKRFSRRQDFGDLSPLQTVGRGFSWSIRFDLGVDYITMLRGQIASYIMQTGGTQALADSLLLRDTRYRYNAIFKKSSSTVGYTEYMDFLRELVKFDDTAIIVKLKKLAGGSYGDI